jgi:hypothetical protein
MKKGGMTHMQAPVRSMRRPAAGRGGKQVMGQCTVRSSHFFLPVETPYDRQLLLEHVDRYLRSHGAIRLELPDREWKVTHRPEGGESCSTCGQMRSACGQYQIDARRLCRRCAHALLLP